MIINAFNNLFGKYEKPVDGIKAVLKEIWCENVDLIQMAQDRVHNRLVAYKRGHCLDWLRYCWLLKKDSTTSNLLFSVLLFLKNNKFTFY
jgi:hypothetical protein